MSTMLPRISLLPFSLVLLLAATANGEPFSCTFSLNSKSYDLSILPPLTTLILDQTTPPTRTQTSIYISLCDALKLDGEKDAEEGDRCKEGSRVCSKERNFKKEKVPDGDQEKEVERERITRVIDWAEGEGTVEKAKGKSNANFVVNLTGGSYNGRALSTSISFTCSEDAEKTEPTIKSMRYSDLELGEKEEGKLELEWVSRAGCDLDLLRRGGDKSEDDEGSKGGGGGGWGVGTFFLLIFCGLAAYFAIGIYNNHKNFGARGWDLIPHRDFWRDLPYLLRDIVTGGRTGRSGYSAL
ncbi:hypothetical protein BT69DRAFT_1347492 [Atractiella rhizophila]|nr:hypothetical protein BT69DRAFT_1347492 [Atractiella rhizophila]